MTSGIVMQSGGGPVVTDLVKHAAYQQELLRVLYALTTTDGQGATITAMPDVKAIGLAVFFRRRHGLPVDERVDPTMYLVGLHRALIRHKTILRRRAEGDSEARDKINYSEHWLIRNGHSCDVDELFNPKPAAARHPARDMREEKSKGRKRDRA